MHHLPLQAISKKADNSTKQADYLAGDIFQLQTKHNEAMDALKIQHRKVLAPLKDRHAKAIQSKNDLLKQSDKTIQGYEQMFTELLLEMEENHVSRQKMDKLSKRAAETHANFLQHKVLYNALKNEMRHQQETSLELHQQLEEYEETTNYLYDKIDNMKSDFDSMRIFIDLYYEEKVAELEPWYIRKHKGPNRNFKGMSCLQISCV